MNWLIRRGYDGQTFYLPLRKKTRTTGGYGMETLMGGLTDATASRKVVSVLLFSIRQAARKNLLDDILTNQIGTNPFLELLDKSGETLIIKRNKTLVFFNFFQENKKVQKIHGNFGIR